MMMTIMSGFDSVSYVPSDNVSYAINKKKITGENRRYIGISVLGIY